MNAHACIAKFIKNPALVFTVKMFALEAEGSKLLNTLIPVCRYRLAKTVSSGALA